jgi:predicted aldo/keto reductase-like oxidoreductase
LQTDYADILLVPDVSTSRQIKDETIMEVMFRVKQQGKARFIGIATHAKMAVAINAAIEADIYDVVLTSINFTMADDTSLLKAIKNAADSGLGVIAMKTQAGGARFPDPSSHRNYSNAVINSAALKWVCHNENIATSIPGFATYDHLRANHAIAMDPEYTAEEKRFLADNKVKLSLEFCRQCRRCLSSCPSGAEIPTLMRTHMYAHQYADFVRARHSFRSIPDHHGLTLCTSCAECVARCANSVNIPRKIEELKSVYV